MIYDMPMTECTATIISVLVAMGRDRSAVEDPSAATRQDNPFAHLDVLPAIAEPAQLLVDEAPRQRQSIDCCAHARDFAVGA